MLLYVPFPSFPQIDIWASNAIGLLPFHHYLKPNGRVHKYFKANSTPGSLRKKQTSLVSILIIRKGHVRHLAHEQIHQPCRQIDENYNTKNIINQTRDKMLYIGFSYMQPCAGTVSLITLDVRIWPLSQQLRTGTTEAPDKVDSIGIWTWLRHQIRLWHFADHFWLIVDGFHWNHRVTPMSFLLRLRSHHFQTRQKIPTTTSPIDDVRAWQLELKHLDHLDRTAPS